jgi:hypothetical protein
MTIRAKEICGFCDSPINSGEGTEVPKLGTRVHRRCLETDVGQDNDDEQASEGQEDPEIRPWMSWPRF